MENEIQNKEAREKFNQLSGEERHRVLNASTELQTQVEMYASKILLDFYIYTCGNDEKLKTMLEEIRKYDKVGFQLSTFKDLDDQVVFQLHMVKKDYTYNIYAPTKYTGTIYQGIGIMINYLQMYHIIMCQTNPIVINYMRALRPDIDFSKLHYEEDKKSTFYFDPELEERIGVICVWLDKENKIIFDQNSAEGKLANDAKRRDGRDNNPRPKKSNKRFPN